MKRLFNLLTVLTCLAVFTTATHTHAQNIDLATVPNRDTVQLTIYNAEDITLVRETRVMTFAKGVNTLKFSWANTQIDPTSVRLAYVDKVDQLSTIDTVYPHDRKQELTWRVDSEFDGEARVEITYFTSGITWSADYNVIVNDAQDHAHVTSQVTVTNRSGEDYEDAQVRLVVGKINLVERIQELANRGWKPDMPVPQTMTRTREEALRFNHRALKSEAMGRAAGAMMDAAAAPEIVREGLSEYFIFTVSGTQTVPNNWSKKLTSFEAEEAPVKIAYRMWPQNYGMQLVKVLVLNNTEDAGMGDSPLPDGQVQVFQTMGDEGDNSLRYLGQTHTKYIAIGDKFDLNLGVDPKVNLEWQPVKVTRDNIWATSNNRELRQLNGDIRRNDDQGQVVGWTDHTTFVQTIVNDTDRPIDLSIRRPFYGDVTVESDATLKLHDLHTVEMNLTIDAATEAKQRLTAHQDQGRNAEDNQVQIKQ